MSPTSQQPETDRSQRAFNLTMAVVAGQVGCLTTVIVIAALLLGLWLDSRLDTRPTFTIILIVGSVPVTLAAMIWIVRKATSKMTPPSTTDQTESLQEELDRGTKE